MVNVLQNTEYDVFKEQLVEALKKMMEGFEININQALKNNGLQLDGITAIPISEEGQHISPTLYIQPFYDRFLKGESVTKLADAAKEFFSMHMNDKMMIPIINREEAERCIYAQVVNAEANKERLASIPHKLIADGELAVILRWRVPEMTNGEGMASFVVNNGVLETAMLTKEEALNIGIKNTAAETYQIKSMMQVMKEMMGGSAEEQEVLEEMFAAETQPQFFVLTNTSKMNGASVLCSKEAMTKAAEDAEIDITDYYILPSSIHEVLLVNKSTSDINSLEAMVQEVNATQVKPEELLSNLVMAVHPETHKLVLARSLVESEHMEMPQAAMKMKI